MNKSLSKHNKELNNDKLENLYFMLNDFNNSDKTDYIDSCI